MESFVSSLKLINDEDRRLATQGCYRGKDWRSLEEAVGETGISAVACCEHTVYRKNVRKGQATELAEYLQLPEFLSILELAQGLSHLLEDTQTKFDNAVEWIVGGCWDTNFPSNAVQNPPEHVITRGEQEVHRERLPAYDEQNNLEDQELQLTSGPADHFVADNFAMFGSSQFNALLPDRFDTFGSLQLHMQSEACGSYGVAQLGPAAGLSSPNPPYLGAQCKQANSAPPTNTFLFGAQ